MSVPRVIGLLARKTGCPLSPNLIIINSETRSHFPPGLSLLVEYHFVCDPGPRNDQRPAGNLFANRDTSVELAIHSVSLSLFHHMMSLNIDMKIIRPWNCSGSPILVMNSWTLFVSCNAQNLGKIFHSNSIGSLSVVSNVLYCDESLNHSICRFQNSIYKSGKRRKTGASPLCTMDENCFLCDPTWAQDVGEREKYVTVVSTVPGCDVTTVRQHYKGSTSSI